MRIDVLSYDVIQELSMLFIEMRPFLFAGHIYLMGDPPNDRYFRFSPAKMQIYKNEILKGRLL